MELNEAALIETEITLRNLRLTAEVLETRRSIARWLALSLGVINPGESRLSAVAVLDALINFQFVKNLDPSYSDLEKYIGENWEQMNEKTLRYHLLKLKNMGLVENSRGKFYFKPPSIGDRFDATTWANKLFEQEHMQISNKVGEVIKELKKKQQ
ncbi:MAG: hypothetical protein KGH61_00795 [Candidatus Micrarchaeota archaeon]|nr:hypothetical protein [Candidatus Micrarchaeota archaeon]MDE1847474.1 hypothetical protein [Candidatus Micrarchaeota archaeon]MDE1864031.1 hypothetical protein [Candidatus Micrarchaeota archaeon]